MDLDEEEGKLYAPAIICPQDRPSGDQLPLFVAPQFLHLCAININ